MQLQMALPTAPRAEMRARTGLQAGPRWRACCFNHWLNWLNPFPVKKIWRNHIGRSTHGFLLIKENMERWEASKICHGFLWPSRFIAQVISPFRSSTRKQTWTYGHGSGLGTPKIGWSIDVNIKHYQSLQGSVSLKYLKCLVVSSMVYFQQP